MGFSVIYKRLDSVHPKFIQPELQNVINCEDKILADTVKGLEIV
jgi:hypothetical protein